MMPLRNILVATDLTETSDEVLRAAAALAALTDATLHVLHAFDLQLLPYMDEAPAEVGFAERIEQAETELDRQIRRTIPEEVVVATRLVEIFVAHRAILDHARAVKADLVVLGPHRRRGRRDGVLGSTADHVIRTAEMPCLIVRGPLTLPLRRVVAPVDLSEPAIGALEIGLAWAHAFRPHGDDVDVGPAFTVIHVVPRLVQTADFPFDRAMIGPELHEAVAGAIGRVPGAETLDVREEVCWGDVPARAILDAAEREDADLLVMGTHGHGAVRRALLGSVATAVARDATRPVLMVPPALWNE